MNRHTQLRSNFRTRLGDRIAYSNNSIEESNFIPRAKPGPSNIRNPTFCAVQYCGILPPMNSTNLYPLGPTPGG